MGRARRQRVIKGGASTKSDSTSLVVREKIRSMAVVRNRTRARSRAAARTFGHIIFDDASKKRARRVTRSRTMDRLVRIEREGWRARARGCRAAPTRARARRKEGTCRHVPPPRIFRWSCRACRRARRRARCRSATARPRFRRPRRFSPNRRAGDARRGFSRPPRRLWRRRARRNARVHYRTPATRTSRRARSRSSRASSLRCQCHEMRREARMSVCCLPVGKRARVREVVKSARRTRRPFLRVYW